MVLFVIRHSKCRVYGLAGRIGLTFFASPRELFKSIFVDSILFFFFFFFVYFWSTDEKQLRVKF